MGQSLTEIAAALVGSRKKVQLIYAFNGSGKTRLSREFRLLVSPKDGQDADADGIKVLYYNAFTEDLFYWDNDLDADLERKLTIRPNGFTGMVLDLIQTQGLDGRIISNFQRFTSQFLTPIFSPDFSEIKFSIQAGNEEVINNIKISKGEESNFIWCVFFSFLEQIVETLNIADPEERPTRRFDHLKYAFIDDPVSSLDDNHLIELAVNLAILIKGSNGLEFIVSTHSPLFYNVMFGELNSKACYMLSRSDDGSFLLIPKSGDANRSFSYHLFLKQTLEEAIASGNIQKYHFLLLRNLYEKTASFLGYPRWASLLPDDKELYYNRVIQFTSHSTLSNEVVPEPTAPEKETLTLLFNHLKGNLEYCKE